MEDLPQNRLFWVLLTIFGSIFTTGLFVISQSLGWGLFEIIIGLIGMIVLIRDQVTRTVSRLPIRKSLLVLTCIAASVFVGHNISDISETKNAVNTYVLPRSITQKQSFDLREYLSRHEPSAVSVKVVSNDQEASEYAAQLFNALLQTTWDIDPPNHDGPGRLPSDWPGVGLCIQVGIVGQPTNPDPKHPAPDVILMDALRYAHIEVNCNGGSADTGKYSVSLFVGRRPMAISVQPWWVPFYQRVQRWLGQ